MFQKSAKRRIDRVKKSQVRKVASLLAQALSILRAPFFGRKIIPRLPHAPTIGVEHGARGCRTGANDRPLPPWFGQLDHEFDLDGGVEGEFGDADGGAGVEPLVA